MKPIVRKPVKIPVSREREGSTRAPTQPNGQLSYKCKHTSKMKMTEKKYMTEGGEPKMLFSFTLVLQL